MSNSSSSSYLIARDPEKPIRVVIELPVSHRYPMIQSIEELDVMFAEDYDEDWREKAREYVIIKYNKCRAALEAGKELMWVSGSNDDCDGVSQLIYNGIDDIEFLDGAEIVDRIP